MRVPSAVLRTVTWSREVRLSSALSRTSSPLDTILLFVKEFAEHHNGGRERSAVVGAAELQSAPQKMHVAFSCVVMPPVGIHSRRKQAYDECALERFFPCFPGPFA